MTKNRDDFEELCESIVSTVKVLQEKISRHGVDVTSSLQQLCEELEQYVKLLRIYQAIHIIWVSLLQEIRLKLGQIQVNRKKRVLGLLKEFGKSTSIGDELVKYKVRLEKLRSDFIVSLLLPIDFWPSCVFQAHVCGPTQHQWYAHSFLLLHPFN
jgi:hypothetical protein